MYLTKIVMNPYERTTHLLLKDAHRMHRTLCRAFGESRSGGDILHRIHEERGKPCVYVYSANHVDSTQLDRGLHIAKQHDMTKFVERLHPGSVLRFDLMAVPSKKLADAPRKNSRRVLLREREDRLHWIQRKAEENGFRVLTVAEAEPQVEAYVHQKKENNSFYVRGYRYAGTLQVTDMPLFRVALENGIGPEKAFGFGMLMVTP